MGAGCIQDQIAHPDRSSRYELQKCGGSPTLRTLQKESKGSVTIPEVVLQGHCPGHLDWPKWVEKECVL